MAPRNRSSITTTHKGRIVTGGVLVAGGYTGLWQGINSVGDQTGSGDCAPFYVSHKNVEGGRVNVFNSPGNFWEDYRVDFLDLDANLFHLGAPLGQDRSDADYATEAVARTNPSRPYVDIPANILQLGDIVRTMRKVGHGLFDTSLSATGQGYLRYQFGIAPLVGDLVKLANFQDQVQRRILELDRLAGPRGLRRTLSVGGWSATSQYWKVMQSHQYFWGDTITHTTTQSIRAHVRWLTDGGYAGLSSTDKQRLALRSVLGLTFDSSTVWEAVPWSWLIDWCSSVGNYFQATRNIVPAVLSGVHIMRETRSEIRTVGGINSPIMATYVTKSRNPSFVAPVAHFPFLNAGQMGILSSLAAARL